MLMTCDSIAADNTVPSRRCQETWRSAVSCFLGPPGAKILFPACSTCGIIPHAAILVCILLGTREAFFERTSVGFHRTARRIPAVCA